MKDVPQIINTSFQKLLSFGMLIFFIMTIIPRRILAIEKRMARDRSGGIDSIPSFTAAHDDPHIKHVAIKPIDEATSICSINPCCDSQVGEEWLHFHAIFLLL